MLFSFGFSSSPKRCNQRHPVQSRILCAYVQKYERKESNLTSFCVACAQVHSHDSKTNTHICVHRIFDINGFFLLVIRSELQIAWLTTYSLPQIRNLLMDQRRFPYGYVIRRNFDINTMIRQTTFGETVKCIH